MQNPKPEDFDGRDVSHLYSLLREAKDLRESIAVEATPSIREELELKLRECQQLIVAQMYKPLHQSLRPLLRWKFPKHIDKAGVPDARIRFTSHLDRFFTRISNNPPEGFSKFETFRDLRKYASVALSRSIIDVLQKDKKSRQFSEEESEDEDVMRGFAAMQASHFQRYNDLDLTAEVISTIDHWCDSDDHDVSMAGLVLRYRYIGGMKYPAICEQLGIPTADAYRHRDRGIAKLKKTFGTASDT